MSSTHSVVQGMKLGLGGSSISVSLGPLWKITRENGVQEQQQSVFENLREWTEKEDALLENLVEKDVAKGAAVDWGRIQVFLNGQHSELECKRRYLNLQHVVQDALWSVEDDVLLLESYVTHGAQWTLFTKQLGLFARTPVEVSRRWKQVEKVLAQQSLTPQQALDTCPRSKLLNIFSIAHNKDARRLNKKLEDHLRKKEKGTPAAAAQPSKLQAVRIPDSQLHLYDLDPAKLSGTALPSTVDVGYAAGAATATPGSVFEDAHATSRMMFHELDRAQQHTRSRAPRGASQKSLKGGGVARRGARGAATDAYASDAESVGSTGSAGLRHIEAPKNVDLNALRGDLLAAGTGANGSASLVSAVASGDVADDVSFASDADDDADDGLLLMSSSLPRGPSMSTTASTRATSAGTFDTWSSQSSAGTFAMSSPFASNADATPSAMSFASPFPRVPLATPSAEAGRGWSRGGGSCAAAAATSSSPGYASSQSGGLSSSDAYSTESACSGSASASGLWGALSIRRDRRAGVPSCEAVPAPAAPAAAPASEGLPASLRWLVDGQPQPQPQPTAGEAADAIPSLPSQILQRSKSKLLTGFDSAFPKTSLTVAPEMRMDFTPDDLASEPDMAGARSQMADLRHTNMWLSALEPYRCVVKVFLGAENTWFGNTFSRNWCVWTMYQNHYHGENWRCPIPDTSSFNKIPTTLWSYLSTTFTSPFNRAFWSPRASPMASMEPRCCARAAA